jgi:hypothetical protein
LTIAFRERQEEKRKERYKEKKRKKEKNNEEEKQQKKKEKKRKEKKPTLNIQQIFTMFRNKNSLKNLKPPFGKRDPKEQREISKKGGIKSGEARRERKRFKEIFELLLAKKSTNDKGETATIKEIIAINTVAKAVKGDLKAVEIVRDAIGEKLKANDDEKKVDN